MREQFENMPEVRKKLKDLHPTIVWFSDQENEYASSFDGFQSMVIWLNGAWYTYQEQQKLQKLRSLDEMAINQLAQANQVWRTKCDELQERIEEVLIEMKNQLGAEDYYGMERPNYDAMLYALRNIKDILKGNKDEN